MHILNGVLQNWYKNYLIIWPCVCSGMFYNHNTSQWTWKYWRYMTRRQIKLLCVWKSESVSMRIVQLSSSGWNAWGHLLKKKSDEETSLYKWSEKYADLVYAVLGFSNNIKHQHCTQRNSICLCCINKRLAGSQRHSYWESKLKNSKYNFVTSWSKKKN